MENWNNGMMYKKKRRKSPYPGSDALRLYPGSDALRRLFFLVHHSTVPSFNHSLIEAATAQINSYNLNGL